MEPAAPARRSHSRGLAGIAAFALALLSLGVLKVASGGEGHTLNAESPPPPTIGESFLSEGTDIGSALAASDGDGLHQALLRLRGAGAYGTLLADGICSGADSGVPPQTTAEWRSYLRGYMLAQGASASVATRIADDLTRDWSVTGPGSVQLIRPACPG